MSFLESGDTIMNNKSLPSRFSVKPLALLIPIASLAILSSTASALGISPPDGVVSGATSSVSIGALFNSLTVTNTGTISPSSMDGVEVLSTSNLVGGINNAGSIAGGIFAAGIGIQSGASVGNINNDGVIAAGSAMGTGVGAGIRLDNATVATINNSGTITGNIELRSGADVTGAINNGGLISGEIFITASGPMPATSSIETLNNSGTIFAGFFVEESEVKGSVINAAGGVIGGIFFEGSGFGGDLNNAGVIASAFDGEGFEAIPATLTINGDLSSTYTAVAPIEINLSGQIINTGSISSTAPAVTLMSGPPPGPAKPSSVVSDPAAIYLNYVNMADGIYNDGTISSTAGTGIRVENSNLNIIANTGTITGGNTYAIFIDDTAEVKQIDNSGVINGIVDFGAKGGLYKSTGGTSGAVVNATSLQIGAATAGAAGPLVSTINGNFTFSGPMTFDANGFDGGIRYGQLDVSGNAAVTGALNINVSGETFFGDNEVLELIKAGGGLTTNIVSAEDNSLLLDFTISTDASSLFATVERENVGIVVETLLQQAADINITDAGAVNTAAIAISIQQISVLIEKGDISRDSALGQTIAQLQGITDPVLLVQAIKSLEPESGGAGSEGSKAAAGAVSAVIANRQASLRNSLYETGMVAGDDISITGFWIQGYDKDTEQEVREGIDGFDVDMYGVALGADAPVGERTTVGAAISYADSQVDSTGIENNEMGIDSYQISSYVSFNEDDYYLDALVSFARNEYDGKRNLFNGLTATADYSGDQYGLRARGGYPFVFESGVHVTPNTSIEYSYLKEEGYSDEGAGNSGLDIDSQSLEALVWAAGVKVAYPFTTESDTTWMPDFHIEVRHDFIADEVELDTNFVGVGGAGFATNGASVERVAYKAGSGLRAWRQSSESFMFRYDYTYKKDYNSQSVAATMRYSF
jgi:uncharacterized protein with beta-barrel porin domain